MSLVGVRAVSFGCPRLVETNIRGLSCPEQTKVDALPVGTLSRLPDPVKETRSAREIPRNPPIRQYQATIC